MLHGQWMDNLKVYSVSVLRAGPIDKRTARKIIIYANTNCDQQGNPHSWTITQRAGSRR